MIGQTVSHYKILEKLGEGGMGEVFLAEDTELRRKVALKFLPEEVTSDPDVLARFKREAQTAASLNHPNIITVYEVGQHGDRPYIAMAYVDGTSLEDLIESATLTVDQAVDIATQICNGLNSAHQAGIVHRDIKPANILIDKQGHVKILDFGLAKLGGVSKLTEDQSTLGTIFYMSPEQVRGDVVDHRSDIFSFGAVLYEMLAGRLPFKGEHSAAVIYSITNEEPVPFTSGNRNVPPELERVVFRALAKDPARRYQNSGEMLTDLGRIRAGLGPVRVPVPRGNILKYVLPTSFVFVAVILFVIFKPIQFEFSSNQSAVATSSNSLAIMYFDNFADPGDAKKLGEITTNLLITDLSESEYLKVVSSQRLYDILKQEGMEGRKSVDRSTATDVAKRADAKWMLLGSILQEEPNLIATSQLVDVSTGEVVASQKVEGGPGDNIFTLVDRLSTEIKSDLTLPAAAETEEDTPVAQVTTHSTDAYRHYLEGIDYLNMYYGPEAKAAFEKAIEYDSTFAMAYWHLGSSLIGGSRARRRAAIDKAVQYSGSASDKERHYIMSTQARLDGDLDDAIDELQAILEKYPNEKDAYAEMGEIWRRDRLDTKKAIESYRKVIEIDPADKRAYNILAYAYQDIGDIDNYIWAIYQYMALAPDEANPYDSRGDLYGFSGKLDKAIKSYERALERKPDFWASIEKLGHMHLFNRDYESASFYYDQLEGADDPDRRAWGRLIQAIIPAYQLKLDEAIQTVSAAMAADEKAGFDGTPYIEKLGYLSYLYLEKQQLDRALELSRRAVALGDASDEEEINWQRSSYAILLSRTGDPDGAREQAEILRREIEADRTTRMTGYWVTRGWMAMENDQPDSACMWLERAAENAKAFWVRYPLALAYLQSGRLAESITELEAVTRRFASDRAWNSVRAAKAYYYLGLAYQQSGRPHKAVEPFEEFLAICKNADSGIPEVEDAKRRLALLKTAG